MFSKLPSILNLHIFSFFSYNDVYHTKTINKDTNKLNSDSILWKNLLKRDFFVQQVEAKKIPEHEYRKLVQEFLIEAEKLAGYMTAFLCSFEIAKQNHEDALTHEIRIDCLDANIFESEKHLLSACNEITTLAGINKEKIQQKMKDFLYNGDLGIFSEYGNGLFIELLIASLKLNLPIHSKIFLAQIPQKNQLQLDRLLITACRFLNPEAAKLLIELGADVNAYFTYTSDPCTYTVTCLYEAFAYDCAGHLSDKFIDKMKLLVAFLLNHAADPDKKIIWTNESGIEIANQSIRDLCIELKIKCCTSPACTELLDLIISSELTPQEPPLKQMRV